jgi:mRNA-degrading endonuclease toxin of MazEF toxin-antitoxin module
MAGILRGDIRWADLNPVIGIGSEQGGLRPVLILSQNVFNERSGTVIAVAITSQPQIWVNFSADAPKASIPSIRNFLRSIPTAPNSLGVFPSPNSANETFKLHILEPFIN